MPKDIDAPGRSGTLLALEERIMFDGAAIATGAEVVQDPGTQDYAPQDQGPQTFDENPKTKTSSNPFTDSVDLFSALSPGSAHSDRNEIVFIDTSVDDFQTLMAGIDPNAEVILLDSTRDGIEQISEILSERTDIDALHIISHGDQGELRLGTGVLNLVSMQGEYADELAIIQQAFTEEADWLIYGCNFGEGSIGREATTLLAQLTGADIAASNDLTGNAQLDGDWDLEVETGKIETIVVVNAEVQRVWAGLLADTTVSFQEGVDGYASTQDTQVEEDTPTTSYGTNTTLEVDLSNSGGGQEQALIRFDSVFGSGAGQIPLGSTIISASLTLDSTDTSSSTATVSLHRMLTSWSESSTWNSLTSGVSTNDVDASSTADATIDNPEIIQSKILTGLESTLQAWSDGDTNYGWVIISDDTDGMIFSSSENGTTSLRPQLTVEYRTTGGDISTGLIGHWTFDANANDSSGNSYNGTLTNGALVDTTDLTDKVGVGKLSLDGSNDYVDLTAHVSNFSSLTEGTIAAWIKTTDTGTNNIFEVSDTADGNAHVLLSIQSGNLVYEVVENGTSLLIVNTSQTVNDGAWHHVAVTVDSSGNSLYIDGQKMSDGDLTYSTGSSTSTQFFDDVTSLDSMTIGVDEFNGGFFGYFDGLIDDTRVYNAALSVADIAELAAEAPVATNDAATTAVDTAVIVDLTSNDTDLDSETITVLDVGNPTNGTVVNNDDGTVTYTPTTSYTGGDSFTYLAADLDDTVSYWRLDGNGTDAVASNDGTLTGTTTVTGVYGNALSFDEVDDKVVVSDFAMNNEFSLSFKFKVDDNTGFDHQYVYSHGDVDFANALNVFLVEDSHATVADRGLLRTVLRDTNDTLDNSMLEFDASSIIGDGLWHTYTLTVASGGGSKVYLDGVLKNSDARGGDSFNPTTDLYFGAREDLDADRFYGGSLDSVQLFNRALSAEAVNDAHTGGSSVATVTIGVGDLVVDTASDIIDGDTSSIGALMSDKGTDGFISLREAITAANNTTNGVTPDEIHFNIAGAGPHAIEVGNVTDGSNGALPTITDSVIIDGYTQSGASANTLSVGSDAVLRIELDGSSAGSVDGLLITAGNSTIRGLAIYDFNNDGISLVTNDGNVIEGNFIGTNVTGTATGLGNSDGVDIDSGSDTNTIGGTTAAARNIISGNTSDGVDINGVDGNVVVGNYIGTDAAGTADLGNTNYGVNIKGGASSNTIGGTATNARNIISGNNGGGIEINNSTSNAIEGNYIGLTGAGDAMLANTGHGIWLTGAATTNTVGGNVAGARNYISGNTGSGVFMDAGAGINTVSGNTIGLGSDGLTDFGNLSHGVFTNTGNNTIGGTTVNERNVISGNAGDGIQLANGGDTNTISGNYIGLDEGGTTNRGNDGSGIDIDSNNSTIGGTTVNARNVIAFNVLDGISVSSGGTSNSSLGNHIYSNTGLGIDLNGGIENGFGVTDNDNGDGDTGANNLQNFPVLTEVDIDSPTQITIAGTLDTDGLNQDYRVEFFKNTIATGEDSSNHGEGEIYLGFITATTNGSGDATFSTTLTATVVAGEFISATATEDLGSGNYGDSSEFALNMTAAVVNDVPVITNLGGDTLAYTEGDGAQVIEQGANAAVSDVDSADFDTGTLTISIVSGIGPADNLAIRDEGTGAGQIGVSGSNVTYQGVTIGSRTGGNGGAALVITLDADADATAVSALVQNITFENTNLGNPTLGDRTVRYVLTDGDSGTSANYDTTVTVAGTNDAPIAQNDAYTVDEDTTFNSDPDTWFDSNWNFRRTLSFDNVNQTENLTDFPVLITLNSSNIDYSQTRDQGQDLRFLDSDGTVLDHEIEVWNESGTSYVWVRVPQIDGSSDTDFMWVYYGNASAPDGQNASSVWSNSFQAVYHLNENPSASGTVSDATGTFDGTNVGTTDAAGSIGNAQDFDGTSQYVDLGTNQAFLNNTNSATLSAWVNADTTAGTGDILGVSINGTAPEGSSRAAMTRSGDEVRVIVRALDTDSSTTITTTTNALAAPGWHHVVGVVDYAGGTIAIYVDGVAQATTGSINFTVGPTSNTNSSSATIGTDEDGGAPYFDGKIDEARIVSTARSADWVAARYAAENGTFVTYGYQQSVAGILGNDIDAEGETLTATNLNTTGTLGSVTLNSDGSFTYNPNGQFENLQVGDSTTDTFTYTANDGTADSNTATVTMTITGVNDIPVITNLTGDTLAYTEGDGAQVIEQGANAVVTDVDSANFDTGTLTVAFTAGSTAGEDVLSIRDQGAGATNITVAGSAVSYGGTQIGTFTGGSSGTALVITLDTDADATATSALVQNITYTNTNTADPSTSARTVRYVLTDGDSGTSANYDTTVTVAAVNDIPVITNLTGDTLAYTEGDGAQVIEQGANAVVTDVDSANFDTGTLTVAFTAGSTAGEDVLSIRDQGAGATNITVAGSAVSYGGTQIGTFTGGSSGTALVITLDTDADATATSALVQNITYTNTNTDDPSTSARTVRYVLTDGDSGTSANYDTTVTVAAVNDIPVITNLTGDTLAYTEGDGAQVIEQGANAVVTDVDSANFDTGTLTVVFTAGSTAGEDVLSIRDQGAGATNITVAGSAVSYGGTQIGTFTGGSSGADLVITLDTDADATATSALVQNITYTNTNTADPSTSARTVRYVLTDGDSGTSANYDTTVTVAAVNDIPVITNLTGDTLAYTEGDGAQVIEQGANAVVTDVDSANFDTGTLTVAFTAGSTAGEDVLSIRDQGAGATNITVAGSAVSYGGTQIGTFTGGSSGTALVITLDTDADATATSALVQNITYTNTNTADPSTSARTVRYVLTDGDSGTSANYDTTVTVAAVNDIPVITNLTGDTLAYTEGDGAQVIEQGANAVVTDVDSANFDTGTLTVAFTAGSTAGEDVLSIRDQGAGATNITVAGSAVSYGGTQIGTFTGGSSGTALVITLDTDADATATSALVQNITYTNTNTADPSTSARTVRYVLTDGDSGTSANYDTTVTVAAVNDIPVITNLTGDTLAYTEGDGAQVIEQGANAVVTDVDSANFDTGTLTVVFTAGSTAGEDVLSIRDQGAGATNITVAGSAVSYGGTQIGTFTGGSSGADLVITLDTDADATATSALVQNITYTNTNTADPSTSARTVRYVLTDGDSGTSANYDTTVTVVAVNDEPTLTATGSDPTFTEGGGAAGLFSGTAVSTVEAGQTITGLTFTVTNVTEGSSEQITIDGATISLANGQTGSTTDFTYSVAVAGTTATVTLSGGTASTAAVVSDIDAATYSNTSQAPTAANRVVTFTEIVDSGGTVNGGDDTGTPVATSTVTVVAVNDAPVAASIEGVALTYTENDGAVAITGTLAVSDVDDTNLESGVVQITGNYQNGEDVLAFTDQNGITGTWSVGTGTLSLSGTATVAQYEAAVRSLTYENTSDAPSTVTRTVSFTLNDGTVNSNTQTRDIAVTAVNDAPVIISDGGGVTAMVTAVESQTSVTTVLAADADLPPDALTYTIVGGADQALFVLNGSSGVLTFMSAPDFEVPTDADTNGVYEVTVQVADGNGGFDTQAIRVNVIDGSDAPVITSDGGGATAVVTVEENQTAVTTVTATDSDLPPDVLTYMIVGGADSALFSINSSSGVLTFMSAPDFEAPSDANLDGVYEVTVQVADGNGGFDTQIILVPVTDVFEGLSPLPPNPTPEPAPEPSPEPEPSPDPSLDFGAPLPALSGHHAEIGGRGSYEENPFPRTRVLGDVLDLPPFLRPTSWATTSDQLRSYYADPLDIATTKLSVEFSQELNRFSDNLEETMTDRAEQRSLIATMMKGSGLALSAGFAAWLVRGGALLTWFLASLPAWRQLDPIPILGMGKHEREAWARRAKEAGTLEAREHHGLEQILQLKTQDTEKSSV